MKKQSGWRLPPFLTLILVLGALLLSGAFIQRTLAADSVTPESKIEPLVLEEVAAKGSTDFFIWMAETADLSPAYAMDSKLEKGTFVFNALRETAEASQQELRAYLDAQGITYQPFYIANKVLVQGGSGELVQAVAARPDVARITANHLYQLDEPFIDPNPPEVVGSNIAFVNANDVWALGYNGAGTVLAGNDTGLDWDHPAIINQYRGWNGSSANHNYNWWDATGTYPTVPNDGHGHGTHTTGTMVGDDGGTNQIGMAPGAKTVHCKNMTNSGSGNDSTFTTCFQWDLAPWNLSGANPDPAMAPDAINNSWGYWGGNAPQFENEIAALRAAGIVVEVSAGNEGPSCATLRSPGDYDQSLTTGSVQHSGGVLPGSITSFSSRGPSDLYPNIHMPDVMAPGQNINSSLPGGGYSGPTWSGTSMAGPHVAGLIGLIWDAAPALQGNVIQTEQIIKDTAVRLTGQTGSNCGGNYTVGPNNDWGYGTIDALAAVNAAIGQPPPPTPTPTSVPPTPTPTSVAPTPTPTATPQPGNSVHVADLDGSGQNNGTLWTASVSILIVDNNGGPVAGTQVTGKWSGGTSGTSSCTTDGAGLCTVSKSSLRRTQVRFTVTGVVANGYTYDKAANTDPDGDSNGTVIMVYRP